MPARLIGFLAAFGAIILLLFGGRLLSTNSASAQTSSDWMSFGSPGIKKEGTFNKPRCIAFAPDGTLWVLDLTGRIQHFNPDGSYLGVIHMPDISQGRPQGIDVGPKGFLYVADTHYNQIIKFSKTGRIVLKFGREGQNPGQLFWPCAIVIAKDGTIFTAEYGGRDRIQKWSPDGGYLSHWGMMGEKEGQFMRPAGLALGPKNQLYVADAANHRIQEFTTDGKFVRMWGTQGNNPREFNYPYDICTDQQGRIFTVEFGSHRVQCFSPSGQPLGTWGQFGTAENGLSSPWGLDVTAEGIPYITDTRNGRIVRAPLRINEVNHAAR